MNKFTVLTVSALVLSATAASAEEAGLGLNFGGSAEVEYSLENETWSMEAGPDLSFGSVSISPRAYSEISPANVISFEGVGVEAEYDIGTSGLSVYGATQTDGDLEYKDAQIGARFSF